MIIKDIMTTPTANQMMPFVSPLPPSSLMLNITNVPPIRNKKPIMLLSTAWILFGGFPVALMNLVRDTN